MDINFRHDHKCFNLRVASVIKNEDKILLSNDVNYYTLPGGRVHFGETTEVAIKRAIYEQLNLQVKISKLLSINENFFDYEDDEYHELLFVYLCEIDDKQKEEMDMNKYSRKNYHFISFKEILNLNFKPEFLLSDLKKVTNEITHKVNK